MKDFTNRGPETPREIRKERFEFELTVNGNIICQRYFKINNFNELSTHSLEVIDAIRRCVNLIKDDLRAKTEMYIRHMTPLIFDNEEQMKEWFANEKNVEDVHYAEHIIIRGKGAHEYVWLGGTQFKDEGIRKDYNEFVDEDNDDQPVVFKFSVYDNGREFWKKPTRKLMGEQIWDGKVYPKFIRNGVDISNGRGKYDDMDISKMSHEACLYYWCCSHEADLVPIIIREICETCSEPEKDFYTTTLTYGDKAYNNIPWTPGPRPEWPYKNGLLAKMKK